MILQRSFPGTGVQVVGAEKKTNFPRSLRSAMPFPV
jgi:hypothetical protein